MFSGNVPFLTEEFHQNKQFFFYILVIKGKDQLTENVKRYKGGGEGSKDKR